MLKEYGRKLARLPQPLADYEPSSPERATRLEDKELFTRLVEQLSPDDRRLVEWSVVEDQSHQQIADRLKITVGNARVRLHRLLRQMERAARKEVGR